MPRSAGRRRSSDGRPVSGEGGGGAVLYLLHRGQGDLSANATFDVGIQNLLPKLTEDVRALVVKISFGMDTDAPE